MKRLATALLLVCSTASAGPLADALTRHADADVQALRDQRVDPAARCTLGAVYAQRNDLSRAALFIDGCDELELPADIGPAIRRIQRELKKRLDDSDLARIEVVSKPAGLTAEIDALPGETFTTPTTIFIAPGDYTVQAHQDKVVLKNVVHAIKRSRGAVVLEGVERATSEGPKDQTADFSSENLLDAPQVGGPKDVKHENLMGTKYQKGMAATGTEAVNPNAIADPLAVRETERAPKSYWLGLRLGGGMFDDGATPARAGVAVAGSGRLAVSDRLFLAGRLDWSRRGGAKIDSVGASAGLGASLVDTGAIGLAVIAQLRGDIRFGDAMDTASASRAGAAAAIGIEAALPHSPFAAGLRFEQGLTTLASTRDRALLFELGVDWR